MKKSSSFGLLVWALNVYLKLVPLATITKVVTDIIHELRHIFWPLAYAFILDRFLMILNRDQSLDFNRLVLEILAAYLGYNIFNSLNRQIGRFARNIIRTKMRYAPKSLLYNKLKELGLKYQEDPVALNLLTRFKENMWIFRELLENFGMLLGGIVTLATTFIIIFNFNSLLPIIVILLAIPRMLVDKYYIRETYQIDVRNTVGSRLADGAAGFITSSSPFKEVIQIGAFKFLQNKFEVFAEKIVHEISEMRKKWHIYSFLTGLIDLFGIGLGLYILALSLYEGNIDIPRATFLLSNLMNLSGSIGTIFSLYADTSEQLFKLAEVKSVLEEEKAENDGIVELKLDNPPLIEYKNVTFTYPRSERKVLENFNFAINPGEKIAIVGHNGAGKTTLIKLLTRLYTPERGGIFVNNQNLNDLDIDTWYKNIGVLFQDYNTYEHLTVRENVAIGDIDKQIDDEKIWEALREADAEDFIKEYPKGLDTILSEKYEGGIRPSTGQWQKIAIARFFYRDAPILILDEPTASIDAIAEANIFDRIYKFIEDKTVIIVSHRFSTVRNADRIIVFEHGKIIEEGNHNELLARNGAYARAFNLQAKGYEAGSAN
jgi:ATP-binding cassette subfamily B protein